MLVLEFAKTDYRHCLARVINLFLGRRTISPAVAIGVLARKDRVDVRVVTQMHASVYARKHDRVYACKPGTHAIM